MAIYEGRTVVGVFTNQQDAQQAVEELKRSGFSEHAIGVVRRGAENRPGAAVSSETSST